MAHTPTRPAVPWAAGHRMATGRLLVAAAPFVLMAVLFSRGIGDSAIGYPDADRILMDGVFLYDFLRTFPLAHPFEFAINYYVQYPALSIGYRPPFFPFVESLFFVAFGPETWAARLALLAMALTGGLCWYRLVRSLFDALTAALSLAVLASLPFVGYWASYTMAEIPALSMVLVAAWLSHRYATDGRPRDAVLAALAVGLAVWTKQTAAFALLWLPVHLVAARGWRVLLRREVLAAIAVLAVVVAPVAAMTLHFGDMNLAQSIGENPRGSQAPRLSAQNLMVYPRLLLTHQLTWPAAAFAAAGALWAIVRRDRRLVFFGLMIAATFVFFTALNDPKLPRYTIFWLPAFALLASLPVHYAADPRLRAGLVAALVAVIAWNSVQSWTQPRNRIDGFEQAAAYVAGNSPTRAVLVDAYNNGYFTYFLRKHDPLSRLYVLRGDKLLTSSAVESRTWLTTHAEDVEDIRAILRAHGVGLVVVESRDYTGVPIHQTFRDYLRSSDFVLEHAIPVVSNLPRYRGVRLEIYRCLVCQGGEGRDLRLDLPIVGKRIVVPRDGGRPRMEPLSR